uniref:Uncharacterized protein n=1 Tax=Marseillevirus LCMAC102 TaxID=2506603 RepID=A0A481YTD9_9VIRU|nr:MAG: uncharacterized protein LCMAC102_03580 [Marseillevirus LCMAC102]
MEEDIITYLFNKAVIENTGTQHMTIAEKTVAESEAEFKGFSEEHQSRKDERTKIDKKLRKLGNNLRKHSNIKNLKYSQMNNQKAKKRSEIRRQISLCKLRLQEIADEE